MKTRSCSSAFSLWLTGESTMAGGGELKQKLLSGRSSFSQAVSVIWSQGKEANEMKKAPVRDYAKGICKESGVEKDPDTSSAVVCSENWCFTVRTGALRGTAIWGIALMLGACPECGPPPPPPRQWGEDFDSKVRRQPQLLPSGTSASGAILLGSSSRWLLCLWGPFSTLLHSTWMVFPWFLFSLPIIPLQRPELPHNFSQNILESFTEHSGPTANLF